MHCMIHTITRIQHSYIHTPEYIHTYTHTHIHKHKRILTGTYPHIRTSVETSIHTTFNIRMAYLTSIRDLRSYIRSTNIKCMIRIQ